MSNITVISNGLVLSWYSLSVYDMSLNVMGYVMVLLVVVLISQHGSEKLVVVVEIFCNLATILGGAPSSFAICSMIWYNLLLIMVLHFGQNVGLVPGLMIWSMSIGSV